MTIHLAALLIGVIAGLRTMTSLPGLSRAASMGDIPVASVRASVRE